MTKLKQFIEKHEWSVPEFAELIGVDKTAVWCWLRGEYMPSIKKAKKIVAFSKGELTLDDIYN